MKKRLLRYFVGLFIMTIGIALSVKSDLGVSPVSSIPYTMTVVWGIEMGLATFLFHIVLVLIQILLLRKRFKSKNLIQLAVGIVFGLFTTLCNYLVVDLIPGTDNILIRILMLAVSIIVVAIGLYLYVPADIMPLAGEGTMLAVSEVTHFKFSNVKIGFDVIVSAVSLCTCLAAIGSMGSVGAGTVVSAVLTGMVLGLITKLFEHKSDDKKIKLRKFEKENKGAVMGETVLAGSSLMEMFPINKLLSEHNDSTIIYNRGVGGFVSKELIDAIDVCILQLKPSKLFINIGTNDLSDSRISISQLMSNYEEIISRVESALPNVKIYLMAYYPVNYEAADESMKECLKIRNNDKLQAANAEVEKLALRHGQCYIDINRSLKDEEGRLKAEYTIEGLHINELGYRAIYDDFMKYVKL